MFSGQNVQVRPAGAMPQVVQFPFQQTIPVQVPINTGNGQTVYQTVHVPLQTFASQMPGLIQPQMQIFPQMAQVANIITPNGQIQQIQLAPMNQLQGLQSLQGLQGLQTVQQAPQPQNVVVQQAPNMATNQVNTNTSNSIQTMPTTSIQVCYERCRLRCPSAGTILLLTWKICF